MKLFRPKRIDISQTGLAKVLGCLEAKIMEYMWQRPRVTAREVCDFVNRTQKISFNAVNTVLGRLVDKGALQRKKEQSYFFYTPVYSREKLVNMVTADVFNSLIRDKKMFSVSSFLECIGDLSPEERKRLLTTLKKS